MAAAVPSFKNWRRVGRIMAVSSFQKQFASARLARFVFRRGVQALQAVHNDTTL
jgi:hypothetical protein